MNEDKYQELKRTIILDIETATVGSTPNAEKDLLKFCGIRLPSGKKIVYNHNQLDAIQRIINQYTYVIGHNIKEYDRPILERYGIKFNNIIVIDTMTICMKRLKIALYMDVSNFSLRYLAQYLKLNHLKGDFDYSKLRKPLNQLDYKEMVKYLEGDLDTTYDLYLWLYNMFYGLKEYLSPEDKNNMYWLTDRVGMVVYRIFCHLKKIPLVINNNPEREEYKGAYIWTKDIDSKHNNIYCFDFNSLYPHMMIGGNLFSPTSSDGWSGTGIYDKLSINDIEDVLKGQYSKIQGIVEKFLVSLYNKRAIIKKDMKSLDKKSEEYIFKDSQQLACKIILNTAYGVLADPTKVNIYNITSANDVTAMARNSIKYAINVLNKEGYNIIYVHTDSIYVKDPFDNKERLFKIIEDITKKEIESFNIKTETHKLDFEKKIKHMYLFRDSSGNILKARNLCILDNDEISFTGIKMAKSDTSQLAKNVFNKYMIPLLNQNKPNPYFNIKQLYFWLYEEAKLDESLLLKRFRLKDKNEYATQTGIHYSLSSIYGSGEHYLVSNHFFGGGKTTKYAKLDEIKKILKSEWLDGVNFNTYLSDLSEFVLPQERSFINKIKKEGNTLYYNYRNKKIIL